MILCGARFLGGAEAVAIEDGCIVKVGALADMPSGRRVDLGGAFVIPGFHDAHVHLWKMGDLLTRQLDLRGVRSVAELQRAVLARAGEGWILGRGFNDASMDRMPVKADLDVTDRPVLLTRTCGHIAVANSRALALAGVGPSTEAPAGGVVVRDAHGEPNGVLQETAMSLVGDCVPPPTNDEYEAMILAAMRHQLSLGITRADEAGVGPELLEVYRRMDERQALPSRVNVMALRRAVGSPETLPLPELHHSDFLRVDTIKILADGGLSGGTAALRGEYRGGGHGVLRLEASELVELCREAQERGLSLAVHAIGDRAIDVSLDAFEALGPGPRHRIEHFGLPDAAHIARARRLAVIAVPQTIFVHALGANFRQHLHEEIVARAYPLRAMLDAGLTVALSSDAPVVADDNPLLGMQAAVLRRDAEGFAIGPDEAVTAVEALRAYTLGAAEASGVADEAGSLAPGKWADLAALDGNPLEMDPTEWTRIKVLLTYVGGEVAFER